MARFVMNATLASGGYPWTVIRVRDRNTYLQALDGASIDMDINPFAAFVAKRVRWSLEQHDLRFPEPEARYDFDPMVLTFWGKDGETSARCAITREAIELKARRKYLDGETEPDGSVLIRTGDLEYLEPAGTIR